LIKLAELETQPKMPPWALIISSPTRWNSGEIRRHAVTEHDAFIAAVIGLANGRVHAHLERDAANDERLDAAIDENLVQVRGVKGALARLVDDRFAGDRINLIDDVVPLLRRERGCGPSVRLVPINVFPPRVSFAGGQSDRSGRWPSRVWTMNIFFSRAFANTLSRGGTAASSSEVSLPSISPKPPGKDEVALHVDDNERSGLGIEVERRTALPGLNSS